MMRWWLERGVDGFRMDVINLLSKDPSLPDGEPTGRSKLGDGFPFFMNGPRTHEFLQEMHREVFARHDRQLLTVGETPRVTIEDALLFTDSARRELDMVFQFDHMSVDAGTSRFDRIPLDLPRLKVALGRWQTELADKGWNSLYWNNHDQARAVSRFGDDGRYRIESAKLLGTVLHLQRDTPYVYQGEELGMTNVPFARLSDFRDIESLNFYAAAVAAGADPETILTGLRSVSRDNARSPMQWDGSAQAGFTTGTPWLPVNPNAEVLNAEIELANPHSVFHHYRRLIALRRELPVIALGDVTMLLLDDPDIFAFARSLDGVTLLVVANFSAGHVPVLLSDAAAWSVEELLLGNYPTPPSDTDEIVLRPWEARVYRRG